MADTKSRIRSSNVAALLVMVNVAVFVTLIAVGLYDRSIGTGGSPTVEMLADGLGLPSAASAWLRRPWTALTYMFTQYSWRHIFGNMIVLYLFASLVGRCVGKARVVGIYLTGGLAGAALYLALGAAGMSDDLLVGSSASVMALMGATAVMRPGLRFPLMPFGRPKAIWVIAALVGLDMLEMATGNVAGHLVHLAGFAAGCVCGLRLRESRRVTHKDNELSSVLEKVRQSGFASLNERERATLFSNKK